MASLRIGTRSKYSRLVIRQGMTRQGMTRQDKTSRVFGQHHPNRNQQSVRACVRALSPPSLATLVLAHKSRVVLRYHMASIVPRVTGLVAPVPTCIPPLQTRSEGGWSDRCMGTPSKHTHVIGPPPCTHTHTHTHTHARARARASIGAHLSRARSHGKRQRPQQDQ